MFKSRRPEVGASPLATPIVIHKLSEAKHVDEGEVLQFLSGFVNARETELNNSNVLGLSSTPVETEDGAESTDASINQFANASQYISQLKRIERDFKGLPPTVYDTAVSHAVKEHMSVAEPVVIETEDGQELVSKSVTGGTKKTFV